VSGTSGTSGPDGNVEPPDGWELVDGTLHREFAFADFVEAFGFMTSAALVAQAMDHHPDWSNSWNRVIVDLSSHDAGTVTERDVTLARRMDELAGGRGDR
jgi:4a-hydroxytetrahydrobiopterin dehydratase